MTIHRHTATLLALLALLPAHAVLAHPHINMLPASTNQGAPLSISHYGDPLLSIQQTGDRHELWYDDDIYTVTADTLITEGDYAGLLRGPTFNFTADGTQAIAATLGPVGYEILDVRHIDTDAQARVIWQFFGHNGNPTVNGHLLRWADTAADNPAGRSFLHNPGDHVHSSHGDPDSGFFLFTDGLGMYDITIRAWDTTGHFTASDPLTFRFHAIPEPATASILLLGFTTALLARRHCTPVSRYDSLKITRLPKLRGF